MLDAVISDEECRRWLASLENPTKTRHGFRIYTIQGDITSDWIKLHGQHEVGPERFILDHSRPEAVFLDIGANIGYFSLLAAIKAGAKVVSFEPQKQVADLLARSVDLNQVGGLVRLERIALSNSPATMRMTACPGNTGHSQLANPGDEGVQDYPVAVVVLDDWIKENRLGPVSVCKIDAEGADLRILEGMTGLLDRDGPAIVVEIIDEYLAQFGGTGPAILKLLESRGYVDVSARYTCHGDFNRYFARA